MLLQLYSTTDGLNVINKTLSLISELAIKIPREVDISRFDLVIKSNAVVNIEGSNYAILPELGRSYFIGSCVNLGGELWRVGLVCDVLETYKSEILASVGRVKRGLRHGDYASDAVLAEDRKVITKVYSNQELEPSSNLIITTVGG